MQIGTPFAVPLAICDFSSHLPFLLRRFGEVKNLNESSPGHATNLKDYEIDGSVNEHLGNSVEADSLRTAIAQTAFQLAEKMGYAVKKYEPVVKNFWMNEMVAGAVHPKHSHYGNHFSGCMYIDVPQNSGGIKFSSPVERFDRPKLDVETYTPFNSMTWLFNPEPGQLFIWESWIQHEVPASQFEGVRRSAAFDVIMKRI